MAKWEALVKLTDNINESLTEEEKAAQLYQAGDIVVIRPKGWNWGREEVKHFLIVELPDNITEEEVSILEESIDVNYFDIQEEDEFYEEDGKEESESEEVEDEENGEAITDLEYKRTPIQSIVKRRRHKIDIDELLGEHSVNESDHRRIFDRDVEHQPLKNKKAKWSLVEDKEDRREIKDAIKKEKARLTIKGKDLVPEKLTIRDGTVPKDAEIISSLQKRQLRWKKAVK